ncbi:PREDICTED: probably inactive leucine-rich repeat receptor-like protein kinase At5g48380 [Ipomoea nil]|uniref:probably inactive leucine-rich repeat receptor-like protein kinase At5g48380 n=1 Tax=Ipomoea nil TaxID=35883 RepID=UPI000900AF3F|nr:PREDICTED: probably inactive leucine-rich repeat receptor-like protein kinase At5g48380 [Ipomoea nil]
MYPCGVKCLLLLLLLLALHCGGIHALQSDIDCLRSLKDSLEDPLGYLQSWDFTNQTEGFICKFVGVYCWHADENKVLNIQLSDMGLRGPFPLGIQGCSSLTGLDLSANQLYGTIPSDVGNIISRITTLDLSSNRFSGEIPASLANCEYLNVLKLNDNQLTGQIPPEFGLFGRIKVFSVSNNSLTGPVPTFSGNIPAEIYEKNEGLCGGPLRPCPAHAAKGRHSDRDFFISGFATGWAIFVLLALYICLFGFPYAAINKILFGKKLMKVNGIISVCPAQEDIGNQDKIAKLEKFVSRMSFMEMANATSNFSQDNIIGCGTLGKVYKATPPNGWLLAIKRLHETENLDEEFASEIMTLGRLRHQNLVPLIGFCSQGKAKLLVYKYMPNGSLHDWLHSTEDRAKVLTWPLRMKIAVGVAKALSWLHYACRLNVVHNGLCSKCILMDQSFKPRISKFWEATVTNPNDTASSSWEEYGDNNFSPYTKDVYCFGIVLLQLITRKEAYELSCSTDLIFGSYTTAASPLQIDEVLTHAGFDDSISQFLEIGKSCVKFMPNQRPTMLQVYESLSSITHPWLVDNNASAISMECCT